MNAEALRREGNIRWNMARPESEVVGVDCGQLVMHRCKVVDQAKILESVQVRHRGWIDAQGRKRENTGPLPLCNVGLDLRSPHEVRLVRSGRTLRLRCHLHIVVGAADLVLGAVAAKQAVKSATLFKQLPGFLQ